MGLLTNIISIFFLILIELHSTQGRTATLGMELQEKQIRLKT